MTFNPWAVEDRWGFEYTSGPYAGVVIQVADINFDQAAEGQVTAEYYKIFTPAHLSDSDLNTQAFEAAFQTTINEIVSQAIQDYEQNRNDNIT